MRVPVHGGAIVPSPCRHTCVYGHTTRMAAQVVAGSLPRAAVRLPGLHYLHTPFTDNLGHTLWEVRMHAGRQACSVSVPREHMIPVDRPSCHHIPPRPLMMMMHTYACALMWV